MVWQRMAFKQPRGRLGLADDLDPSPRAPIPGPSGELSASLAIPTRVIPLDPFPWSGAGAGTRLQVADDPAESSQPVPAVAAVMTKTLAAMEKENASTCRALRGCLGVALLPAIQLVLYGVSTPTRR